MTATVVSGGRAARRRRIRWVAAAAAVAGAAALPGCGGGDPVPSGTAPAGAGRLTGSITVAAAASLRGAFERIGAEFEAANPGVEIEFSFDASSSLASQVLEGAPLDVFAAADEANVTALADEGLVSGEAAIFARNRLVIVTKPGNPAGVGGLADLATLADGGVVALCGDDVPCGRYAAEALDAAGVTIPADRVTRGQNATATLTAVAEGDAVAGIVYVTDAMRAAEATDAVDIPDEHNVTASYPIAVLAGLEGDDAEIASAFVAYVLSPAGRAVLDEFGFLPPP